MNKINSVQTKKKGIQSIEIGFSIINILLKSPEALPLKEISNKSGLSPSKIHTYLVSFCEIGLVQQEVSTNHYYLGPYALQLGLGYLDQANLFALTKPVMQSLASDLGYTVFLGVWGNRGPTIINRIDGANSHAFFDLRIGSVLPILSSALGLNFAANYNPVMTKPFIEREIIDSGIFNSMDQLDKRLDLIRLNGVSVSSGKLISDYTAISAPIFNYSSSIIAGLTIMGGIGKLDDNISAKPTQLLLEAASKISTLYGYTN